LFRTPDKSNQQKNMMKNLTSAITKAVLALSACAALNANAGTAVAAKTVAEDKDESLFALAGIDMTGSMEVGWDSRYYFRGLWFADHTAWGGFSASVPLKGISEKLTFNFGALYTSNVDTKVNSGLLDEKLEYSELDLISSLTYDFDILKATVVYTSYQFFDGFSGTTEATGSFGAGEFNIAHTNELGLVLTSALGPVNVSTGYYYDFNIGGSYFEVGADCPFKVASFLTLVPAVKAGYGLDYYSNISARANGGLPGGVTSGITHAIASLAAPVNLTKSVTLTPYVAYNFSGRARESINTTDNEVFGGVKLGVSF